MAQTKKVAFLLPSLKFGGGERVALNLAHAFKAKGLEVDFLLMSFEGEFLSEAIRHFNVVDLECSRTWMLPGKLARHLLRHRSDALISSFWKLNLCACLSRLANPRTKLIAWEHSPPTRSSPAWLYAISSSILYRLATRVVAVSSGVAANVLKNTVGLRHKVSTIFNPIAPPINLPAPSNGAGRKKLIWVGRLDAPKNPSLMLEAFSLLPKHSGYVLDFVGEGRLRPTLERRASELGLNKSVNFLGFQSNPYASMAASDMLVLTSDSEGLPTVLIEALYVGLRIVSTDCGEGVHDILGDNTHGLITPTENPIALATAIQSGFAKYCNPSMQRAAADRFKPEMIAGQFAEAIGLEVA